MQAKIADLDVKEGINKKQQNKLNLMCLNPLNIFDNKDVAVVNKNCDVGVRPKSASREMQAIIADLEVKGGINQQQFQLKLW